MRRRLLSFFSLRTGSPVLLKPTPYFGEISKTLWYLQLKPFYLSLTIEGVGTRNRWLGSSLFLGTCSLWWVNKYAIDKLLASNDNDIERYALRPEERKVIGWNQVAYGGVRELTRDFSDSRRLWKGPDRIEKSLMSNSLGWTPTISTYVNKINQSR